MSPHYSSFLKILIHNFLTPPDGVNVTKTVLLNKQTLGMFHPVIQNPNFADKLRVLWNAYTPDTWVLGIKQKGNGSGGVTYTLMVKRTVKPQLLRVNLHRQVLRMVVD